MEAIKKKVQAMKVEKDNLCDRCDEVEQVGGNFCRDCRLHKKGFFLENERVPDPKG